MPIQTSHDKVLFTPGPLTTSLSVKSAMLHDAGSWHHEFNELVKNVREKLLDLAGVKAPEYTTILLQGSGTYGVEATFATSVPPDGHLLIMANGAYGERMVAMAKALRIPCTVLRTPEDTVPDLLAIENALASKPAITHVAAVHCETTTGILNNIQEIGQLASRYNKIYIVDAMSSFGAIPIDFAAADIDYLISSPNKCLEGVPGFSFVIGRRAELFKCEGFARSLSLDLLGQLKGFEKDGKFRYTPPTHTILAFIRALEELQEEGGIAARSARYQSNFNKLLGGMEKLGFKSYLPNSVQSYIITSFHFPEDPAFTFAEFYRRLSDKGFLIYPGKISQVDLFRIGSIGRIVEADIRALLAAIRTTIEEMGISLGK